MNLNVFSLVEVDNLLRTGAQIAVFERGILTNPDR